MLRSRKARREESMGTDHLQLPPHNEARGDPEQEAVLADSIGLALLVVLGALNPEERIAFVLHDIFVVPYAEIAPIVERSEAATRKLASRARRRIQGAKASAPSTLSTVSRDYRDCPIGWGGGAQLLILSKIPLLILVLLSLPPLDFQTAF